LPVAATWDEPRFYRELGRVGVQRHLAAAATELLEQVGAITISAGIVSATDTGCAAAAELADGRWAAYADLLMRSDALCEQLTRVLRHAEAVADGLRLNGPRTASSAPQLAVVLGWLSEENHQSGYLGLPNHLLARVTLAEPPSGLIPVWVQRNGQVGWRAEMYSLLLLRTAGRPADILHVAADSAKYGYDIEDRSAGGPTYIEVKGSAGTDFRFFITLNERDAAKRLGKKYLLHFWGGLDLTSDMQAEYTRLRSDGYPLVIDNPEAEFETDHVDIRPSEWSVVVKG
jgi:hypothetical protein